MTKICAVYKITNKITGECYIGSSKNVYRRWIEHRSTYTWKKCPNNRLYQNMQKYGLDQFRFEIIVPAAPTHLKICEQEFINIYKPTYNNNRANGTDKAKKTEYDKRYREEHRAERAALRKQYNKEHRTEINEYMKQYNKEHRTEINEYYKQYYQQHRDSYKEYHRKWYEKHKAAIR